MPTLIAIGNISATGGATKTLDATMFYVYGTSNPPLDFRLPVGGSYTNCSRRGTDTLDLTNPGSNSTYSFTLEWIQLEAERTGTWYSDTFSGHTLYASLGPNNISTTLVKNAIGESVNTVSGLCSSGLVNKYAEYCPNGSSPYKLGDFRWYAHSTSGGCSLKYIGPPGNVAWKATYTVTGYLTRIFKELTNKPYSQTRVVTGSTAGSSVNLNNVYGTFTSETNTNPVTTGGASSTSYTVKSQHYYSGSWVDGNTTTFTINFDGCPFTISYRNKSYVAKELTIGYNITSADYSKNIKLIVPTHSATAYDATPGSGSTGSISLYNIADFTGDAWSLQIEYPASSGTYYTMFGGVV